MGRTLTSIVAIVALACAAFSVAYFGGSALSKAPAVAPAGAAVVRGAPELPVGGQPVALRTATPTPSPTATPKPKPKKKHQKKKPVVRKPTPVVTQAPTSAPTRVPVYKPPPAKTARPKPHKTPGIIIED